MSLFSIDACAPLCSLSLDDLQTTLLCVAGLLLTTSAAALYILFGDRRNG